MLCKCDVIYFFRISFSNTLFHGCLEIIPLTYLATVITCSYRTVRVIWRLGKSSQTRICIRRVYTAKSNISRTKSQNLNVSPLVLQLSLPNLLKSCVKLWMKMQLEQRWQAMLQQHLRDHQFNLPTKVWLILEIMRLLKSTKGYETFNKRLSCNWQIPTTYF